MKRTYILLLLCCALVACKRNSVDFSISPEAPRAGQPVTFTNLSSSGEDWAWTFGDGVTSTLKSPTHTFKQPGTYLVTLKVDNKRTWTRSKELTVYDTIPTFTCSDSVLSIYKDYTFSALIYNPYNYPVELEWSFPLDDEYVQLTDTNINSSSIKVYFTRPLEEAPVELRVVINGDTTSIRKTFTVQDKLTNSLLIRTTENDYRQRIFVPRAAQPVIDSEATPLLDAEQDTAQTYNGYNFTLSELKTVFSTLQGFHIANRKIYYRANGLWVANIDGAYQVQIDSLDCPAMVLDMIDNRIYWANEKGVWYMPFIGSDNNRYVSVPTQINNLTGVTKLAADYTNH